MSCAGARTGSIKPVEMRDIDQCLALAHQRVLDLGMIGESQRHSGDERLVRWNAQMPENGLLIRDPRRLRAGIEAELPGSEHDRLQVHAGIRPVAAAEVGIHRHEQADRRVEEQEVAGRLPGAGDAVPLGNATRP